MHYHTYPDEPGHTPAFCYDHATAPEMVDEGMYECESSGPGHECYTCEEESPPDDAPVALTTDPRD